MKILLLGFTIFLASFCLGFNILGEHAAATILLEQNVPPPDEFLESKGSFVPPSMSQTDTEVAFFMAPIGPVEVFSNNIKNNSNVIDFGDVPINATTTHDMTFNFPYQVQYYVYNKQNYNISIDSIQLGEIVSNETRSPFEFCGLNYNNTSIHLPPGHTQALLICFYPEMMGPASSTLQFYQGNQVLFSIPIKGNGINSEETSPLGSMNETANKTDVININLTNATTSSTPISKIPSLSSSPSFDTQSFLTEPLSDCQVIIEGGGQRPDPAVSSRYDRLGNEIVLSNITPLSPPDDGLEQNDTTTHHHKINVGQLVKLEANVSGLSPQSIKNISWTVTEPTIKDYDETIPGKFVTYNLTAQDYLQPAISFYWKDTGEKRVTVTVEEVGNNQSKKCSTTRTFNVERNHNDIDRQAADFYVFNHNATNLANHFAWHVVNRQVVNGQPEGCHPLINGEEFFTFHKDVISNYESFLETFGYPALVAWDPADNPPKILDGYNVDNNNRNLVYVPVAIPSHYTIKGGNTSSDCALEWNQNVTKLGDYMDANHLGSELEATWHGIVHGAVGGISRGPQGEVMRGDMSNPATALKDPVFWMWHNNIDLIYDKYREIKGQS